MQYDLGKMALYIGLAVGFVFLAQYAGNNFAALQMIKYGVNTAFFLAFLGVVWRLEKKHFDTI